MIELKILGTGCPKCEILEKLVKRAVDELGIEAKIEHIKDPKEIAKYTFTTPALLINGKLKIQGVPAYPEVKEIIEGEIKGNK